MKFNKETDSLDEFIWVGDPHVKQNNIEESSRLIEWVDQEALKRDLPVVFAGDQYNDFGIARVEAVKFWSSAFHSMKSKAIALVGNHDANPDMSLNFMDIHSDYVMVIDKPVVINDIGLLPFYRKNDIFVEEMNKLALLGVKWVLCHQEFNGCQYENGFYAPGGVDPELIPESIVGVIGGHIHKQQKFGKIWYPGTARHLTKSDVGEVKGIFYVNLKTQQNEIIHTPIEVSEPFQVINVTPEYKGDLSNLNSSRMFINILGPSAFIKSTLKKIPEGAKVRSIPDPETETPKIKESQGIPKAFFDFAVEYANQNKIGNTELKVMLDKIYDNCPNLKGV